MAREMRSNSGLMSVTSPSRVSVMSRVSFSRIVITCLLFLCLLLSCGEDSTTDTGSPACSRESPREVLLALSYSMEQRDIDVYTECLEYQYRYTFLPEDYRGAGVHPNQPWWERKDDIAAMDSMLSDTLVTIIEADFMVVGALRAENAVSDAGFPSIAGAYQDSMLKVDVSIQVEVGDLHGGEPTAYSTGDSWLYVYFAPQYPESVLWEITWIREVAKGDGTTGAMVAVEPRSFGGIKAMFRRLEECELDPRSNVDCLLRAFEWALEYRDIELYQECLSDDFRFIFDPVDHDSAGVVPDKPWWGKTQDVTTMSALFADEYLTSIICDLEISYGPWVVEGGLGCRLEPYMVFTVYPPAGDFIYYVVGDSWLDIEIVADPYMPGKYVVREMEEVVKVPLAAVSRPGPQALGSEPSTFGGIKAMYK